MKEIKLFEITQVTDSETDIHQVDELDFGITAYAEDYVKKYGEKGLENIQRMYETVLNILKDKIREDALDWKQAQEHLELAEKAYSEIGSSGYFALSFTIRPLRDRFNNRERTQELYDEIMEISL